ncbi:MAG: sugar transferase [Candidatus Electrothrix sp. ATG2]|nr:sugar transferase [Candidatus Electrothrix sp. ATG2]
MNRALDFLISLLAILLLSVPMLIIAVLVKLTSKGPVFYWSERVGQHNHIFNMPKFRTMQIGTPVVATHLLENPDRFLTPVGKFLRKSSLDELPQLLCIIKGDMSFVGPRPALFNQNDLIDLRTQRGVHKLTPGLTGWAQINGRDELSVNDKVEYDVYYLNNHSLLLDLKIIQKTIINILRYEGICH